MRYGIFERAVRARNRAQYCCDRWSVCRAPREVLHPRRSGPRRSSSGVEIRKIAGVGTCEGRQAPDHLLGDTPGVPGVSPLNQF
jgi:hypothetical protein